MCEILFMLLLAPMKHGHAAEVSRPASETHRTHKRVRLRCDAVSVAVAVAGLRCDAGNAWSDAAQQVDTRVQTRPNQIFYYLFKKYLPKTKITSSSPCRKRTSTSSPPFPPLQVSPSFFSEFSHDLICSMPPSPPCFWVFWVFSLASVISPFRWCFCLVLWFLNF